MIYPKKLEGGATIGVICPSSPIGAQREEQCRSMLEGMGYRVKPAGNLTTHYGGFMADEGEVRGRWVNAMFADPEVDAIFCARGGHGGSRVMEYLDLERIRQNPKIFVGYSDVTSLHLALIQECGFVTFHGPMVSSDMVDHFDVETRAGFFHALNADAGYEFKNPEGYELLVLKEGKGKGTLTGGNLALLAASIGTPYEVDTKGKILFIEEVEETVSRIERTACQLRNAGKFKTCAGILLGQFSGCTNKESPDYMENECFRDLLKGLDIPVFYNIQSGHGHPMMTLPLGAECTVDTGKPSISFATPQRERETIL